MSKVVKIAAAVVAVVAITVATAGIGTAPAIGATVTTGTLATGATLTVGTAAVAATGASLFGISAGTLLLASSALSMASGLLAKKPAVTTGSQTIFKADPSAGIPYAIGRTGTAGNIVWRSNSDGWSNKTPNDLSDFVVVHSLGPIQAYESFESDDVVTTFDGAGNAVGANYRDYMFQRNQLGALPEASALAVQAGISPRPSGWGTSAKLSGLAASMWRLRFDAKGEKFGNGTPKPLWVVQGVKVYDPRLDSTYPGGSGACRANDEASWVFSENPYLHALTWLLGRTRNGVRVMGVGVPIVAIDVPAFVEGANVSDANGWKVGGVVYSVDSKWEVFKAILQAGAGEPLRLGAKISCLVQTPRVSLATIGIDDLAPGEVSVQTTQRQRDRINGVIARYRSEAHGWDMVPSAPIRVASYVTADGGQRTRELEFPLVQLAAQAGNLAAYEIQNAREFGPISMPLKLRWMGYKPGDCVTVNLPESGLSNQLMLILSRSLEPGGGVVTLSGRSETTAKHAFALGQTATPPPTPGVSGPPLVPTPASGDWTIAASSVTSGGVTVPALDVRGSAPSSVEEVVFEYRVYTGAGMDPDAGWLAGGAEPPSATAKVLTSVASGAQYQVSVRYRARGASGGRLILGPVTTAAWAGVEGPAGASAYSTTLAAMARSGSTFTALAAGGVAQARSIELFPQARVSCVYRGGDLHFGLRNPALGDTDPDNFVSLSTPGIWSTTGGWQRHRSYVSFAPTGVAPATGQVLEIAHIGTEIRAFVNGVDVGQPLLSSVPADRAHQLLLILFGTGQFVESMTLSRGGLPGAGTFTIVAQNNVVVQGNSIRRSAATDNWDGKARTGNAYVAGAAVSATVRTHGGIGLTTDPAVDNSYSSVDYWLHWSTSSGLTAFNSFYVFRNGVTVGAIPGITPLAGDRVAVVSDNITVRYLLSRGGTTTLLDSHPVNAPNEALFGVADLYFAGSYIEDFSFADAGSRGSDGAPGSNGADGFTVAPASAAFSIACTSDGTPKAGEFNKVITFSLRQGSGADLAGDATTSFSAPTIVGCTAALSGTRGQTLTISAISADSAYVDVVASRSGTPVGTVRVTLTKARDGVSPGPSYPAIQITAGTTTYPDRVVLASGQSVGVEARYRTLGDTVTGTGNSLQVQIRPAGGAWVVMTGGSNTQSNGPGDPVTLGVGAATFTNASGVTQSYEVRTVIVNNGGGTERPELCFLKIG
jgi:hypothetical protein